MNICRRPKPEELIPRELAVAFAATQALAEVVTTTIEELRDELPEVSDG